MVADPSESAHEAAKQARCRAVFFARCKEQLAPTTFIGRRALTLCIRTAAEEAIDLAKSSLRSGGFTRKAADPVQAGHGISMLPDVAREALSFLSTDHVLKRKQPAIIEPLRETLEILTHDEPTFRESDLARLDALVKQLNQTYINDALDCIECIIKQEPKKLSELESICEVLVSDLRARGWTDTSLTEIFQGSENAKNIEESIRILRNHFSTEPKDFKCYVAVTVERIDKDFPADESFLLYHADLGLPRSPQGPFVRATIRALDYRYAAELAQSRVSSVLGAASVFVASTVKARSPTVIVDRDGVLTPVDTNEALPKEHRNPSPGQIGRIIRSAKDAFAVPLGDPVFEAIRHRQRALNAGDLESTFMLLWLGIERLIVGTHEYGKILDAAKSLVPKAITLGKLRRDVAALASAIDYAHLTPSQKTSLHELLGHQEQRTGKLRIDRVRLLEFLLSDAAQSRKLTAIFYEDHPWLVQWYFNLRKRLGEGTPEKLGERLAEYFEASRLRIEQQVLRLYRVRNNVAHAARGPAWIGDLVRHAHYYLTQLIAIVIHYRENAPTRPPAEILMERAGQFDMYIVLVRAGHRHALKTDTLLRPTALLGGPREP